VRIQETLLQHRLEREKTQNIHTISPGVIDHPSSSGPEPRHSPSHTHRAMVAGRRPHASQKEVEYDAAMKTANVAHQATPPTSLDPAAPGLPLKTWLNAQETKIEQSWQLKENGNEKTPERVRPLARRGTEKAIGARNTSNGSRGATVGRGESALVNQCTSPAASPHNSRSPRSVAAPSDLPRCRRRSTASTCSR